jgi:TolA-binding protein
MPQVKRFAHPRHETFESSSPPNIQIPPVFQPNLIFLLAFSGSCGMISRFMSSENPQPTETKAAQREKDVYDLLAWLEVNKTKVAIIAVALVIVGFAIATMRYMAQQKEARANADLLALKPLLTPPTNTAPVQASALLKVAQDHSGTSAGERARFLAANALFTEGKFADAEAAFKNFANEFPESPWRAAAAFGIAAAQEAQNKPEAEASYRNVVTSHGKSAVADNANLALARIAEKKNQPAEALRIYNQILAPTPGVQPGQEMPNQRATQRKEVLLRAHPELNTNTPPAFSSAPMIPSALPSAIPNSGSNVTLEIPGTPADPANATPTLSLPQANPPATNQ